MCMHIHNTMIGLLITCLPVEVMYAEISQVFKTESDIMPLVTILSSNPSSDCTSSNSSAYSASPSSSNATVTIPPIKQVNKYVYT